MSKIMDAINRKLTSVGLKPLHPCTICFYYLPMKGSISYVMLGTQMMAPEMYQNFSFLCIPKHISLTNACLANSVLGSALYLYSRPHMREASPKKRVPLCLFGAVMFNLGSMLMFALSGTASPNCRFSRFILGLVGSVGSLYMARKYVSYVDSQVKIQEIH